MAEELGGDGISLLDLFTRGMGVQRKLENDEISLATEEGKTSLHNGIQCLEKATRMVNQLSLFSKNEGLEDVTTANLKFLLLPALLGDLTMQGMGDDRLDGIQKARIYFLDYLQRSKSYAITSEDVPSGEEATSAADSPSPRANYEKISAERTAKIQRYKQQKELEEKLKELTVRLEMTAASPDHREDETGRDHTLTLLKLWVIRSRDSISSIDQEVPLLQEMERRRVSGRDLRGEASARKSSPPRTKPWKPIVITREMLQSQVYGAGYPSLPTMSVEEFYEQKYKEELEARSLEGAQMEQKMRDLSMVGGNRDEEGEGEKKEEKEEEEEEGDSEEALKKAREWDEFKDDNRTGWGNKKNMG